MYLFIIPQSTHIINFDLFADLIVLVVSGELVEHGPTPPPLAVDRRGARVVVPGPAAAEVAAAVVPRVVVVRRLQLLALGVGDVFVGGQEQNNLAFLVFDRHDVQQAPKP